SAMREIFTDATVIPIQIPLGQAETFRGIIDLIDQKALVYKDGGIFEVGAIPPDLVGKAEEYRLQLVEAAAEADDELLVKYLDGEELTAEEIRRGLRRAILNAKVVPTLCGSALKNIGMAPLLDAIVEYSPSPAERAEEPASELDAKPLSALVFKTIADPYVGRVSLFRVFTGTIKSDSTVYNSNKETEEKVSQLFAMVGKNQQPLPEIYAGDIGAATKLQVTTTGD
ncbi:MAG: elongation factor G, partial [Clostridia bacterium]|nr:elongation factor G [Clostridia bacterium]